MTEIGIETRISGLLAGLEEPDPYHTLENLCRGTDCRWGFPSTCARQVRGMDCTEDCLSPTTAFLIVKNLHTESAHVGNGFLVCFDNHPVLTPLPIHVYPDGPGGRHLDSAGTMQEPAFLPQ